MAAIGRAAADGFQRNGLGLVTAEKHCILDWLLQLPMLRLGLEKRLMLFEEPSPVQFLWLPVAQLLLHLISFGHEFSFAVPWLPPHQPRPGLLLARLMALLVPRNSRNHTPSNVADELSPPTWLICQQIILRVGEAELCEHKDVRYKRSR
jgi:hypothetical protein